MIAQKIFEKFSRLMPLSPMLYGFDTKRKRTLAIEVGMQNAGLGALLALKHFGPQAALIPAAFATWCVITASILAEIWSREGKNSITSVHPQSHQDLKNIREIF